MKQSTCGSGSTSPGPLVPLLCLRGFYAVEWDPLHMTWLMVGAYGESEVSNVTPFNSHEFNLVPKHEVTSNP